MAALLAESTIFLAFQLIGLVYCSNSSNSSIPITENPINNTECSDPNAESRFDNPNCIVTCTKRSITGNAASCFNHTKLIQSCYCKNTFVLDKTTNTCVQPEDCPCNSGNNEVSRYSNDCANGCDTFHTLTNCPGPLRGGCWCGIFYCKIKNGTCVRKERYI